MIHLIFFYYESYEYNGGLEKKKTNDDSEVFMKQTRDFFDVLSIMVLILAVFLLYTMKSMGISQSIKVSGWKEPACRLSD